MEGGVRGVPLLVRDRVRRRVETRAEAGDLLVGRGVHRDVCGMRLERQPDVVPLEERSSRDRGDEVPAARLDGQQPLGDEARQRVVDGAPRDPQLGGELVEAELLARAVLPREDPAPEGLVDLLVEVRAREEVATAQM